MSTTKITDSEKDALSQLVRRLVERGSRPTDTAVSSHKTIEEIDGFSNEGLLLRIVEIEKRSDAAHQGLSKTLNAILSTIERLEAKVARLDGELYGLHEREERRDYTFRQQKEELELSASIFADTLTKNIEGVLFRVEKLLYLKQNDAE